MPTGAPPGGHARAWSHPRTTHWTGWAWEGAGFQVRDSLYHLYTGVKPPNHDLSKLMDKWDATVAARDFVRWMRTTRLTAKELDAAFRARGMIKPKSSFSIHYFNLGQPALPNRAQWAVIAEVLSLRGQQAPADLGRYLDTRELGSANYRSRPVVGRAVGAADRYDPDAGHREYDLTAPHTDLAREWEGWGTALRPGAHLWWLLRKPLEGTLAENVQTYGTGALNLGAVAGDGEEQPRWPTQISMEHSDRCMDQGDMWACVAGCPVRTLEEQGGKSQFYYVPKATRRERELDGETNDHPTLKPEELMRRWVLLVTSPGGRVLDPFMGSGTTGKVARELGHEFTGVELDPKYSRISGLRMQPYNSAADGGGGIEDLLNL